MITKTCKIHYSIETRYKNTSDAGWFPHLGSGINIDFEQGKEHIKQMRSAANAVTAGLKSSRKSSDLT